MFQSAVSTLPSYSNSFCPYITEQDTDIIGKVVCPGMRQRKQGVSNPVDRTLLLVCRRGTLVLTLPSTWQALELILVPVRMHAQQQMTLCTSSQFPQMMCKSWITALICLQNLLPTSGVPQLGYTTGLMFMSHAHTNMAYVIINALSTP